jgi:hypothetical protein
VGHRAKRGLPIRRRAGAYQPRPYFCSCLQECGLRLSDSPISKKVARLDADAVAGLSAEELQGQQGKPGTQGRKLAWDVVQSQNHVTGDAAFAAPGGPRAAADALEKLLRDRSASVRPYHSTTRCGKAG